MYPGMLPEVANVQHNWLAWAFRGLRQAPSDTDGGDDNESETSDTTLFLRIAAVFIILAGGMLGCIPPLFIKNFEDPNGPASLLSRVFSAGIILALALVHVIPEALADIGKLTEYPWGSCLVIVGVVIMMVLESASHSWCSKRACHECDPVTATLQDCTPSKQQPLNPKPQESSLSLVAEGHAHHHHGDEESHMCPDHHACNTVPPVSKAFNPLLIMHVQVMAYLFELGCIFHSVIIGVALGVVVDDRNEVVALTAALAFHQFVEGISLATMVRRALFSLPKSLFMTGLYSVTTPIGVAIGIAIAKSYDPDSTQALVVQGVFNGLSGGMLLYIGLVQLVAEDFGHGKASRLASPNMKWLTYFMFVAGAALMCLLGKWA